MLLASDVVSDLVELRPHPIAALADGKRAISLLPDWGKGYSRAGLSALKGGDEEAAYWFYCNGLKKEPTNSELLNGRTSVLQARRSAQLASRVTLPRLPRSAARR